MKANKQFRVYSHGRFTTVIFMVVVVLAGCQVADDQVPALIPMPQSVIWTGDDFLVDGNESKVMKRLREDLPGVPFHQREGYLLEVTRDSVVLQATTATGLFRGEQTLMQLTISRNGKTTIAGCRITDWPAFAVRGFMQDVGRNYMSLPLLKEQIDVLAAYKFNLFHFHVTDNPGWRLESKRYPQLKDPASMSRWPGKYYTQAEFVDLVKYCRERHITLVPEFDVPGSLGSLQESPGH